MYYLCFGNKICKSVLNGLLYHCFRNSHGTNIGVIPSNDRDCIDLGRYCEFEGNEEKALYVLFG